MSRIATNRITGSLLKILKNKSASPSCNVLPDKTYLTYTPRTVIKSTFPDIELPKENLVQHVWKHTDNWDDIPCTTCGVSGRNYTYGISKHGISKCAQALLAECKLKPGDVVALLLPNIPEFLIISHGIFTAGLILSFANPLYTEDELRRQFQDSNVKAIVTISLFLDVVLKVSAGLPDYKTTICVGGADDAVKNVRSLQNLIMEDYNVELPKVELQDVAMISYSSGTTGLPKGVMLSHENLVANLMQLDHPNLCTLKPNEVNKKGLTVLPYFHIYGFNSIMNLSAKLGISLVSLPKFTPEDYIKALLEHKPYFLFVVPSLLLFLATHPSVTKNHLSSIEIVSSGAALASESLLQKFRDKVGRDIMIRQGYGMTESSPVILFSPRNLPKSKKNTIGLLVANTEAKIKTLVGNRDTEPNTPGELLVRGPQVMKGYLNNPEATKQMFTEDGWMHTGDVVYYDDDGYFYIVDRCKELIKVKGNQVSPSELESIILDLPDIADVAVVGIPDTLSGELPRAFVVKKKDALISENEILEFVHGKVAPYKRIMGGIKFIDSIPRNPSGKILRNELKIAKCT
ncbi:hypothetical protein PPYR_07006 [Photinus pyralis]|uniref:Luciferin 4-monooxygenase n=2 Tax=Photinus pyralis TaxID=7054 RepID=A0A1Y1L2W8_PHOPY|nr:probable 4-coumarate--CoA ligase 1 [Photinus pyralis]XP_031341754.1 probable 4-coumarate--CoA ligase 1 [Photinus pyralis]KAB0799126.1 hypothetical protein PPYR_07006 [Photinus pyralis]